MSLEINSNSSPPPPPLPTWTRLEDDLFEQAIVLFPEETPDRWQNIAALLPGKTPAEIQQHYEDLVHDVMEIESGRIELPCYTENSYIPSWVSSEFRTSQISFQPNLKRHHNGTEKKKGIPWSEEEHRRFLVGLHKYGKGDWRSISRNAVVTRTPTQVASHAQKYFIRLNSMNKDNKRSSIHDITTVDNDLESVVMAQPSDQNCEGGPAIL